jgi:hypothetical protein
MADLLVDFWSKFGQFNLHHSNRQLWIAFIAILAISVFCLIMVAMLGGIPKASELFGHVLGIFGFVLMLMTESLYTLRKRSRKAHWGRMATWLDFHIVTGIVGPFMVLLHSSWKFNGLAGLVTLLTLVIVASGFIGRYIYTAVPRTMDGVEIDEGILTHHIAVAEAKFEPGYRQIRRRAGLTSLAIAPPDSPGQAAALSLGTPWRSWQQKFHWRKARRQMDASIRQQADQLDRLIQQRNLLRRQIASLARARRGLALWHAVHVPLGLALFTAAFITCAAAIYYATAALI